jgi:Fe-S-cluster-containing dehydrogenase component
MIGCKDCDFTCADFVRTMKGEQRSGYRLLQQHYSQQHGAFLRGNRTWPARVDDRCGNCEGKGCEGCEPDGVIERWNFNTLERLSGSLLP